jgi:RHH-type proline utilization regulon transcriptional repressor/proline dehydrogenase/delta 1-pyrroline-5-carboxylate dehydrogenase
VGADALTAARAAVRADKLMDEAAAFDRLMVRLAGVLDEPRRLAIEARATALVEHVRARRQDAGLLDHFLQEFGLSNEEGVALMCLAEALLRVPDEATVDALIDEKIGAGRWDNHLGRSDSAFVNASTWALLLTGRVIALDEETGGSPLDVLARMTGRLGSVVIRAAMRRAMRILGGEFVLGRTIDEAIVRGARELGREAAFSFDMLGEGARTAHDAARYAAAYASAIARVARTGGGGGPFSGSGASVKLSALHPRLVQTKWRRLEAELLPRLRTLADAARDADLGLSIDAEESDRLELTLELFERLVDDRRYAGWEGLGLVVQAYGKRALAVCDWVVALAERVGRRVPVRLVKGAYWDAEIKDAQIRGLADFPVFTQKAHTDMSYLACAARLLAARPRVYPQFATHNAYTLCAVVELAGDAADYEFQRLHGMGALLYATARETFADFPRVRVYAPVGSHRDLLAYLVRRLLENGANSSFVNRFLDARVPARDVVRDPLALAQAQPRRHPRIRRPADLFAPERTNSRGFDFSDPDAVAAQDVALAPWLAARFSAEPAHVARSAAVPRRTVLNPARRDDTIGEVVYADAADLDRAFAAARAAQPRWDALGGQGRAAHLRALAELLERDAVRLLALLVREAGKTRPDAWDEIREAVDYCRYYAQRAEAQFAAPLALPGPTGETNTLALCGRGVFVCISPWNFPLAIFLGQATAALAAGNAVLAKPAEQTPLVAAVAVALAHEAGVPREVLSLVPGDGEVGARLVTHGAHAGVAFTGGIDTAHRIQRALADRRGAIVPFIAETGGQNAMFVDSTALIEQVTDDVVRSAFGAAGQRCSALRVLFLQEDIADAALESIRGAMAELAIGDPARLDADVGPVIDDDARRRLEAHVDACRAAGLAVFRVPLPPACAQGTFVSPTLVELDRLDRLTEEHFGPVLHVLRFSADGLDAALAAVRELGYGLTLGVHTRIDSRALAIHQASSAGNTYVNRNMVGAVVGVQPFGGLGRSGTGPKAGGPHTLLRYAAERTLTINTMAKGGNVDLLRE